MRAARALLFAAGLAFLAAAVGAELAPDVKEVADCIAASGPQRTAVQRIEMKSVDRMGDERSFDVEGRWKRGEDGLSKLLFRIGAPPDLRGTAFLLLEREGRSDDLFSYLPEIGKVRRVTGRSVAGSLFGTDFTYEDVERMQELAKSANTRRLPDASLGERPVYVLETRPGPDEVSQYERIVTHVDRERCVPLEIDFYARGDEPAKVLRVPPERVVREGSAWIPMEMWMEDRESETRSQILVKDVELDTELSDATFSQSALERRR